MTQTRKVLSPPSRKGGLRLGLCFITNIVIDGHFFANCFGYCFGAHKNGHIPIYYFLVGKTIRNIPWVQ